MKKILIIAEHADKKIKRYSIELLGVAKILGQKTGASFSVLLMGNDLGDVPSIIAKYGPKEVLVTRHDKLKHYNSESFTSVVCDIIKKENFDLVLATATPIGRDLLARCAMRLDSSFVPDTIGLNIENDELVVRRPMYAGKVIAKVSARGERVFVTVRPNLFELPMLSETIVEIRTIDVKPIETKIKLIELKETEGAMVDITEADRIVAGGRGVGNKDGFKVLRELASKLNASIGASRAAVDAGLISHDHQVGQTGKVVNPKLYIACGISGSTQHLAGMRSAKVIVAINKDKDAQIFSKADYGIVGDMFDVVPAITKTISEL